MRSITFSYLPVLYVSRNDCRRNIMQLSICAMPLGSQQLPCQFLDAHSREVIQHTEPRLLGTYHMPGSTERRTGWRSLPA